MCVCVYVCVYVLCYIVVVQIMLQIISIDVNEITFSYSHKLNQIYSSQWAPSYVQSSLYTYRQECIQYVDVLFR